jgi:proteasome lid subunit RPN8/RPN11
MMPDVVRITRDALTAIDAHARSEAPVECCGLLLGRTTTDAEAVAIEALPDSDVTNDEPRGVTLLVEQAIPTRNVAETPTRYLIDPEEHFRILRRTRASDLTIVGAYHSHPITRPVPSPLDLDEALPQFLYPSGRASAAKPAHGGWSTGHSASVRSSVFRRPRPRGIISTVGTACRPTKTGLT